MDTFGPDTQPDRSILEHIEELVREEQDLLGREEPGPDDHRRLEALQVELDQYWDLLRQRRARRDAGDNPDGAQLRDPHTVENYEQ